MNTNEKEIFEVFDSCRGSRYLSCILVLTEFFLLSVVAGDVGSDVADVAVTEQRESSTVSAQQ